MLKVFLRVAKDKNVLFSNDESFKGRNRSSEVGCLDSSLLFLLAYLIYIFIKLTWSVGFEKILDHWRVSRQKLA